MRNRVPADPGRVLITPENGSAAFYATLVRADNPTDAGDPLSKETLLQDATAALFGLDATAVPDDVLSWIGKYNQHWWRREKSGQTDYVYSSNRNAYPDSSTSGGYSYQYIGVPFEAMVETPKIETGSYVGTNKYGSSNQNSLTFGFAPQIVIIMPKVDSVNSNASFDAILLPQMGVGSYLHGTHGNLTVSAAGNTVSWYSSNGAQYQLNQATTYYYLAICL